MYIEKWQASVEKRLQPQQAPQPQRYFHPVRILIGVQASDDSKIINVHRPSWFKRLGDRVGARASL